MPGGGDAAGQQGRHAAERALSRGRYPYEDPEGRDHLDGRQEAGHWRISLAAGGETCQIERRNS